MAELLKCRSCKKKAAFVTTKGKLEEITCKSNSGAMALASAGTIVIALIPLISNLLEKAFDWKIGNDKKYIVCKSCGHYELVD